MFSACGSGPFLTLRGPELCFRRGSRGLSMIKAVIFDIDNTLYSYDKAHEKAFPKLTGYAEAELGIPEEEFKEAYSREYAAVRRQLGETAAIHNRLIRIQRVLERRGLPLTPHVLRMTDLYWYSLIDAMEPSPHAGETVRALKASGFRLGIGTDMTARVQFQKLERLGMLESFDFIVSSEEAGRDKPAPELFALCAQKAGCRPEECLFIGDSLKRDVCGALDAGMSAAWYCPAGEASSGEAKDANVWVIRDLSEIPELIRRKMSAGGGTGREGDI